jgi:hypothetical protein
MSSNLDRLAGFVKSRIARKVLPTTSCPVSETLAGFVRKAGSQPQIFLQSRRSQARDSKPINRHKRLRSIKCAEQFFRDFAAPYTIHDHFGRFLGLFAIAPFACKACSAKAD